MSVAQFIISSFNVLNYGADPSGATDSYQAFQDWAQAITSAGGGVGLVPPGTYTIDRVLNLDAFGAYHSEVRNFVFEKCNGLRLVGYGATINMKGDILKTRDSTSVDGHGNAVFHANLKMVGFVIQNCDNVSIEGFDINGNADLVTEDSDGSHPFVEGGDDILSICGSRNVTIRNMRIHHAWTDGISVRRTYPIKPSNMGIGCQQVVIENCEVYANARCNIAGHELRHMRISDCRLHHGGFTGGVIAYLPACNIDIEPDPVLTDLSPSDWSDKTGTPSGLRFIILENCEFVDGKASNVLINVRFSHFLVRGCFFSNANNSDFPCVFSVPYCSIQDSEIDTRTGRIDVALTGTLPGGNVFTMERCLIRATSGEGLAIIPQQGFVAQALIANCRFICEATSPTTKSFPLLETGQDMLMLTFRDNYTFIPSESYSGSGQKICSTMAASLAENNVWETDYSVDDVNFLGVYYHTDASVYPAYPILVRNERFITGYHLHLKSVAGAGGLTNTGRNLVIVALVGIDLHIRIFDATGKMVLDKAENELVIGDTLTALKNLLTTTPNESGLSKDQKQKIIRDATLIAGHTLIFADGTGIRPADASNHNNNFPFSGGISAIGDEIDLGKQRIKYGGASAPTSGSFNQGDLIFNNDVHAGESMGWVCVTGGTAGVDAVFNAMPLVGA
jgi:hypothetical protein